MATAKKYNMQGQELGAVELSDTVFNAPENTHIVHDVAVALMNAQRQGNAETKRRAEVSGGGRKPFRQKGTGNARQGSIREPQMKGGGVVFGPHKRSYRQDVPTSFRRKALSIVLSDRVRHDALCVLDQLVCDKPKTKPFVDMVRKLSPDGKKTLFILSDKLENAILSSRNIPRVTVKTALDLNALDVLDAAWVVVVADALPKLEERLS